MTWLARSTLFALGAGLLLAGNAPAADTITPTDRGAVAETDRYKAEFRDGSLTSFVNKLTGEEYLDPAAKMEDVLPHLPSGLGTQHDPAELAAARTLFDSPWGEQPPTSTWPNQHFADAKSRLEVKVEAAKGSLTYTDLTDGSRRFDDETITLEIEIDGPTGDLLVTPAVAAPRGGVYGSGFALGSLAPAVTVEAPIFEGMRLDRHMLPMLWINSWGSFWDYSFVAMNGSRAGAVGLWCQDAETRIHKTLFYLVDGQRLSLAVQSMNVPPFKDLTACKAMTWRLQAFDKGWWQAAARFRDWRNENVKFAPRPSWARQLCGMITGVKGAGGSHIVPYVKASFPELPVSRVLAWLPDVRRAGFDKNHANNSPYPAFKDDLQVYKQAGMKNITYLIPTIMWAADAKTDREKVGLELSKEAYTSSPFQDGDKVVRRYFDQNHLGHAGWQRWMLDWVKEYIRDYGTDGIYHDQSYFAPIDNRGPIDGMTSPQGYADYFFKAQAENPDSIHATEHLTEINVSGASIGLGCGIHWGTPGYNQTNTIGPPGSMCWQRIKRASSITNALHYPNGRLVAFPHMSSFKHGRARFNHGMDQVERRGDFPGFNVYDHFGALFNFYGKPGNEWKVPLDLWANELWLEHERQYLFVKHGLQADFPADLKRHVLSHFGGLSGEQFQYEETPWGTAFVELKDGGKQVHYARIQGVARAAGAGTILGWPCYDEGGPAGLDPEIVYVVDGSLPRPAAFFALPADAQATVLDGYTADNLSWMQLVPAAGTEPREMTVQLKSPQPPVAVWVDGDRVSAAAKDGGWTIPARSDATIVALLAEPPPGIDTLAGNAPLVRHVEAETRRDFFKPAAFASDIVQKNGRLTIAEQRSKGFCNFPERPPQEQTHIPVKAPTKGVLRFGPAALGKPPHNKVPPTVTWWLNGKPVAPGDDGLAIPLEAGETAVVSILATAEVTCPIEWKP